MERSEGLLYLLQYVSPYPRDTFDKAGVCDGFPERRRICRRLYRGWQKIFPHKRQRRCRSVRFHTLFRFQHQGKSLLEILRSPLFMAYHDGQPFNENHLRPCPMLENPAKLRAIVRETGARSTDMQSPESADHLCDKCVVYAENWAPCAEKLWSCHCSGCNKK